MRRYLHILLPLFIIAALLAGCFSGAPIHAPARRQDNAWEWERQVHIICPWSRGGGADQTLRALQPLLQETLGVPVEILNVSGADGAVGIEAAYRQPADGYTYVLATQSIIMLELQGVLSVDFCTEFQPVAKLVHATNLLATSTKAQKGKYTNFSEFVAYLKAHPQEITCGMLTLAGADAVSLEQTLAGALEIDISQIGAYIRPVDYDNAMELFAALEGGHIHVAILGVDEAQEGMDAGTVQPLLSIGEQRLDSLPDLPCTVELGIDSTVGPWRALMYRKETPAAPVEALYTAVETAWYTDKYQAFLDKNDYLDRPGFADPETTRALIETEFLLFEQYLKQLNRVARR